jgi:hypothetical protein
MTTIVYLVFATAAGLAVGWFRGDRLPYGVAACALAALILAVAVSLPLGDQGPHLFDVAVAPAALGALVGAMVARLAIARTVRRDRARSS